MNNYSSENEDDPESNSDDNRKIEKRRSKRRCSRQMKRSKVEELSSDEEEALEPKKIYTRRLKSNIRSTKQSKDDRPVSFKFKSGQFVIAKDDAFNYDSLKPSNIWRIDGKALLQKYEASIDEGKVKYKSTSVYTGWSQLESEKYTLLKGIKILSNIDGKITLSFDPARL